MNINSLRAKGIEPLTSRRAVLYGWRLRFNVQHFFRHEGGVGNIEPSEEPGDQVLGILHDCPDEALPALDTMEACGYVYDRINVDVGTENGVQVSAFTYVGLPEFIDNSCLPSRRYLNILIDGARQADLDPDYVQKLAVHATHQPEDYPAFEPPPGNYPVFDNASLAQYPLYTALYGAVFDMSQARPQHEYLKGFFGGRDMTLFHLRRMDSSNGDESLEDIRHGCLNADQLGYLNGYLNEYNKEYRYVGRFNYN